MYCYKLVQTTVRCKKIKPYSTNRQGSTNQFTSKHCYSATTQLVCSHRYMGLQVDKVDCQDIHTQDNKHRRLGIKVEETIAIIQVLKPLGLVYTLFHIKIFNYYYTDFPKLKYVYICNISYSSLKFQNYGSQTFMNLCTYVYQ